MYSIITGISDTDDIRYCPKCGAEIGHWFGDGTGKCDNCGFRFGVVESELSDYDDHDVSGLLDD